MSVTQSIQVSEVGFLGSTYTKTGKVLTTATALRSSSLVLDKYTLWVSPLGESPTTVTIARQ